MAKRNTATVHTLPRGEWSPLGDEQRDQSYVKTVKPGRAIKKP